MMSKYHRWGLAGCRRAGLVNSGGTDDKFRCRQGRWIWRRGSPGFVLRGTLTRYLKLRVAHAPGMP